MDGETSEADVQHPALPDAGLSTRPWAHPGDSGRTGPGHHRVGCLPRDALDLGRTRGPGMVAAMSETWSIAPPDVWCGPLQQLVGDRWRWVARPSWPTACDRACQQLIREISGTEDPEQAQETR